MRQTSKKIKKLRKCKPTWASCHVRRCDFDSSFVLERLHKILQRAQCKLTWRLSCFAHPRCRRLYQNCLHCAQCFLICLPCQENTDILHVYCTSTTTPQMPMATTTCDPVAAEAPPRVLQCERVFALLKPFHEIHKNSSNANDNYSI
jgi:hypothetical protein